MARRGKLVLQIAAVGVVGLLLALLGWRLADRQAGQNVAAGVDRGERPAAPDFTLPALAGEAQISLSAYRGKVVVLNFWASWCVPCRDEAPVLQAGWERWRDDGVVFLGVNVQDFAGDARTFVDRYGITYPNAKDGAGSTIGRFGVVGYPETYFIDARGRIVARELSTVEEGELEEAIALARATGGGTDGAAG